MLSCAHKWTRASCAAWDDAAKRLLSRTKCSPFSAHCSSFSGCYLAAVPDLAGARGADCTEAAAGRLHPHLPQRARAWRRGVLHSVASEWHPPDQASY